MATCNDWYSDESDESHYRETENKLYEKLGELGSELHYLDEHIKDKLREYNKLKLKYNKAEKEWNEYCTAVYEPY